MAALQDAVTAARAEAEAAKQDSHAFQPVRLSLEQALSRTALDLKAAQEAAQASAARGDALALEVRARETALAAAQAAADSARGTADGLRTQLGEAAEKSAKDKGKRQRLEEEVKVWVCVCM